MNFYAASSLIVFIASMVSGFAVLLHSPRNIKNILFFLWCLSMSLWSGSYVLWQMATTADSALFWARMLMIGAAFIPVVQFHHILALFEDKIPFRRKFLYLLYAEATLYTLFSFSTLAIKGVEQKLEFPFWPIPGLLMHILFATLSIPNVATWRLIWEQKTKSSPVVQNQLKWLLLAVVLGYAGGGTNLPLWYNIPIRPYLMVLTTIMPVTSALLFFKLGLFDIGLFLRRTLVYSSSCLLLGLSLGIVSNFFFHNWRLSLSLFVLPFVFPPLFAALRRQVEIILAQTSIWKESAALKTIDVSVEKIRETTYTYDDLAKNIVGSLLNTFPVGTAAVYFYDLTKKELHLRAQSGMKNPLAANLKYSRTALAIPHTDPLMVRMQGKRDVVRLEVLQEEEKETPGRNQSVIDSMQRIEADICAPFLFEGKVKGMIVLGKKKNNTLYNVEDIDAIYAFTRMGGEIMRYIMGMESELRNTSLYSHDMAHDIRSIAQTLEVLESPMMMKQPPEKIKTLVHQAGAVAHRLHDSFQLNRDRSNLILRSVRGEYERAPVDLQNVLKESFDKFLLQTNGKKIVLKNEISTESLPILGNEMDLGRMLDNLLGNALRYTQDSGLITLRAKKLDNRIQIHVSDNGQGISSEDIDKIWEMGWQGQDKKGTAGLGLSIVKQIVDLHRGVITVFSDGMGRGTTFTISLPAALPPAS